MASCGKLVGTIAALQCVERGMIAIDDPKAISRILPELAHPLVFTDPHGPDLSTVPATTQITLRHLLSHTSGLAYDFFEPKLQAWRANKGERPVLSLGGDVVRAHSVPLMFEPGTGFVYGGGIDVRTPFSILLSIHPTSGAVKSSCHNYYLPPRDRKSADTDGNSGQANSSRA
jgi:CubicO group peptidase (beta-lactamase class C family)